jgi:hypothetical protein
MREITEEMILDAIEDGWGKGRCRKRLCNFHIRLW